MAGDGNGMAVGGQGALLDEEKGEEGCPKQFKTFFKYRSREEMEASVVAEGYTGRR